MRCATVLKLGLLFSTLLAAFVLAWFTIPFYGPADNHSLAHVGDTINSEYRVTTVHRYGLTYSSPDQPTFENFPPKNNGIWSAVILEWHILNDCHGGVELRIGRPEPQFPGKSTPYPDLGVSLNLTWWAQQPPQFCERGYSFWTRAGDQDGLSMPYFNYADATLFYHQLYQSYQLVYLRLLVLEDGVIQVWKDMPEWDTFNASDVALIDDDDRRRGLVATFYHFDQSLRSAPESMSVGFQDALFPSRTYPLRRAILSVLGPLYLATGWIAFWTADVLKVVIILIVYCVLMYVGVSVVLTAIGWLLCGCPRPVCPWLKGSSVYRVYSKLLLRPERRKIWGPLGPLDKFEQPAHEPKARPKPLKTPLDFFRSSSPLDDLLVTFSMTRWMVQPVWKQPVEASSSLPFIEPGTKPRRSYSAKV